MGRDIAGPLYEKIQQYYKEFSRRRDLAPYTSIINPSGIGKSYAVHPLAKQLNKYVVYTSLVYPPSQDAFAFAFDAHSEKRQTATRFW